MFKNKSRIENGWNNTCTKNQFIFWFFLPKKRKQNWPIDRILTARKHQAIELINQSINRSALKLLAWAQCPPSMRWTLPTCPVDCQIRATISRRALHRWTSPTRTPARRSTADRSTDQRERRSSRRRRCREVTSAKTAQRDEYSWRRLCHRVTL